MLEEMLKTFAANAILAPVLIWFMLQYATLVKKLITQQDEMTKIMTEVRDVIKKCTKRES